jgi:segregation and condensation protein A
MSEDYRVELDVFSGPLDLMLYLIRRDELDIHDVSLSRIADQYIAYVKALQKIDPNAAGEFLVMAATLAELKSRALLPSPPLETTESDAGQPGAALVTKLLEYKRFKDAARALGRAADDRAKRYVRKPAALPKELQGVELEEVQVWDLLKAFNKVMSSIGEGPGKHEVRYDETPIETIAEEIVGILTVEGPTRFSSLFDGPLTKSAIIGRFLAILELTKQRRVRCEQAAIFDEIYLFLLEEVEDEPEPEPEGELTLPPADVATPPAEEDIDDALPDDSDDMGGIGAARDHARGDDGVDGDADALLSQPATAAETELSADAEESERA